MEDHRPNTPVEPHGDGDPLDPHDLGNVLDPHGDGDPLDPHDLGNALDDSGHEVPGLIVPPDVSGIATDPPPGEALLASEKGEIFLAEYV